MRGLSPTGAKSSLAPFLSAKKGDLEQFPFFRRWQNRFERKYSPFGEPALKAEKKLILSS